VSYFNVFAMQCVIQFPILIVVFCGFSYFLVSRVEVVGEGVSEWEMAGTANEESGVGRSMEGISSAQRSQSGEALAEWRSSEQVENGTPSTSPPYWDTDDDDDGGMLSVQLSPFPLNYIYYPPHLLIKKKKLYLH
jgi:hypothetical protein